MDIKYNKFLNYGKQDPNGHKNTPANSVFFEPTFELSLINFDINFFAHWKLKILSAEARILLLLVKNGPSSVKNVYINSNLSYRGFYNSYNKLCSRKIIVIKKSEKDRRVHIVQLSDDSMEIYNKILIPSLSDQNL